MKSFLIIDFEAEAWFDQLSGENFKDALKSAIEDDPERFGWSPDNCIEEEIEAKWVKEEGAWEFARGHFKKYVDLIYETYMDRSTVKILDITEKYDVKEIEK
jgi:hypothetical protein